MLNDPSASAMLESTPFSSRTPTRAAPVDLLTEERERVLLAVYAETGDRDALSEVLQAHLRLVLRIARRHRAGALSEDDLVAEGMLGLVEAARRFDPAFGVRFSTYAAHWARAFIQRHSLAHRRIVAMPDTRAARRVFGRIGRVEPRISSMLGRAPTDDELADALEVTADELSMVRGSLRGRDVPLGIPSTEGAHVIELSATSAGPEEEVAGAEERAMLHAALGRAMLALPDRERSIVERRCLSHEPPTLEMLAKEMSLSRERVRQLEARALSRLRSALAQAA